MSSGVRKERQRKIFGKLCPLGEAMTLFRLTLLLGFVVCCVGFVMMEQIHLSAQRAKAVQTTTIAQSHPPALFGRIMTGRLQSRNTTSPVLCH